MTPGGQHQDSDLAITTMLTLRALFRLPLRQTGELVGSSVELLKVDLAVLDHSTLSRGARTVSLPLLQSQRCVSQTTVCETVREPLTGLMLYKYLA